MRSALDFSSLQGLFTTFVGLVVVSLVVAIVINLVIGAIIGGITATMMISAAATGAAALGGIPHY